MSIEERALIASARAQEDWAIERVLEEYSPMVYHYFLRMGLEAVVAEELAQETFRRVWEALPGFLGNSMLKTWILSIARRVASSHFSKEKGRPAVVSLSESLEQIVELFDPTQIDPEQALLTAERSYTLQQLLDLLPAEEREIVVLHGLEELSQREIAQLLGKSLGWVNKIWKRACGRIKRLLLRTYRMESSSDFFSEELKQWQPRIAPMTGIS